MKVLTLNCWGLFIDAKHIKERFKHIAKEVKEYDIICLQEVWVREDYNNLVAQLALTQPYSHHYVGSSLVGSGLCIFSKYPISSIITHQYRVSGMIRFIKDGEVFAGKGAMCCKLDTPHGTVAVFNTHINPRCRESQLFELMQLIRNVRSSDSVILCGDFNTKDKYAAYRLMTECLNIRDVYGDEPHIATCDRSDNIYTFPEKYDDPKRIDFIFHSDDFAVESRRLALSGKIPGKDFPYSDHEGVEAVLVPSDDVDNVKMKGKMSPNALQTLKVISNQIKSKRDKCYKITSIQWGFGLVMLNIVTAISLCVSMSWLLAMYPSCLLQWMFLPLSVIFGIISIVLTVFVINEHQTYSGLTANIHEINSILLYYNKELNSQ